jgi:hypothetical protein
MENIRNYKIHVVLVDDVINPTKRFSPIFYQQDIVVQKDLLGQIKVIKNRVGPNFPKFKNEEEFKTWLFYELL